MKLDALQPLPERPPSEVEWEDLLLRIELTPRAVRVLLEDLQPGAMQPIEPVLDGMISREERARDVLEEAVGVSPTYPAAPSGLPHAGSRTAASTEDRVDRFVRLRSRNFAMAQRRGISVWEKRGTLRGEGAVTVYQLFTYLARSDGESLAALRRVARE